MTRRRRRGARSRRSGGARVLGRARRSRVSACRCDYVFEPGHDADGITVTVPRSLLGAIRPVELEWLVPAWLRDKVIAYLRALPKEQRRPLVPLPDTARDAIAAMATTAGRQSVSIALAEACARCAGSRLRRARSTSACCPCTCAYASPLSTPTVACFVPAASWPRCSASLPGRRRGRRRRRAGAVASHGAHAVGLRRLTAGRRRRAAAASIDAVSRRSTTSRGAWTSGFGRPGRPPSSCIAAACGDCCSKRLPQQAAFIRERMLADRALVLAYHGVGDSAALVDDLLLAAAEQAFELDPPVRTEQEFSARLARGRGQLVAEADALRELLGELLPLQRVLRRELEAAAKSDAHANVRTELAAQLVELVGPRMLTDTPREWRRHLPRYLRAAEQRWQKRGQRNEPQLAAEVRAAAARLDHWRARRSRRARRGLPASSNTAGCSRSFACRCSRSSSAPCARYPRSGSSRRGARPLRARERYWPSRGLA